MVVVAGAVIDSACEKRDGGVNIGRMHARTSVWKKGARVVIGFRLGLSSVFRCCMCTPGGGIQLDRYDSNSPNLVVTERRVGVVVANVGK